MGLYGSVLGEGAALLPPAVLAMHAGNVVRAEGLANVRCGTSAFARLACVFLRLPKAGLDVPLKVLFDRGDDRETRTRDFGGRSFRSVQSVVAGRPGRMTERFGFLTVTLDVDASAGGLSLSPVAFAAFGIPVPRALLAGSGGQEREVSGRFCFDVDIMAFGTLVVAYSGWLIPKATGAVKRP